MNSILCKKKTDMQLVLKCSKVPCCLDIQNKFQRVFFYVLPRSAHMHLKGYTTFRTKVRGSSVQLHSFLISADHKWLSSHPGRFKDRGRIPSPRTECWVDPNSRFLHCEQQFRSPAGVEPAFRSVSVLRLVTVFVRRRFEGQIRTPTALK